MALFIAIIAPGSYFLSQLNLFWVYTFALYIVLALLVSFALGLMKPRAIFDIVNTST